MDHGAEAGAALKFILRDLGAEPLWCWGDDLHSVGVPENMPPAYLLQLILERYVGVSLAIRPFEKTAWITAVAFRSTLLVVSFEKFGLRIRARSDDGETRALVRDFANVLERAVPQVERAMQTEVRDLIKEGRITIPNNFHLYRHKHDYLRKLAASNYAEKDPSPTVRYSATDVSSVIFYPFKAEREGFFAATAALDAYFSWLEHLLILLIPFSGFDANRDDLVCLITDSWTEKFKRVFDLSTDRAAKTVYELLMSLKEDHRNPYSHGGLDRSLSAFRVHIGGIGAIPARLSKTPHNQLSFHPLPEATFSEICDQLDAADAFLQNGTHKLGYRFIAGGLDVCFDPISVAMYTSALADPDTFGQFVDQLSYEQAAFANFEW